MSMMTFDCRSVLFFTLSSYLLFDLSVLQTEPADRGEQAGIHDAVQPALQATIPGIHRNYSWHSPGISLSAPSPLRSQEFYFSQFLRLIINFYTYHQRRDPWHFGTNADPRIRTTDLTDSDPALAPDPVFSSVAEKMPTKNKLFFKVFFAYYSLKVNLHKPSKKKKSNKSKNTINQGVSYFFCLSTEGSWHVQVMADPDPGGPNGSESTTLHNTVWSKNLLSVLFSTARLSFFGHARSQYCKVVVAFWTSSFLQVGCQVIILRGGGGGAGEG